MKQIVNFSGGKDSTAMLHLMLEKGEQIDDVIFFDGGWEWPQMYDHIDEVERKTGIKISRVKPSISFDEYLYNFEYHNKQYGRLKGYGWPGPRLRWCTRVKIDTINYYLKTNYLFQEVVQCVGYAVGEERRSRRKKDKSYRFPLLEYNYDEIECRKYCYDLGYTWGGLYDYMDRVSCWCCPLQSLKMLAVMKRHFPDRWERLLCMDQKLKQWRLIRNLPEPRSYRQDYELLEIDAKIRGKKDEPKETENKSQATPSQT